MVVFLGYMIFWFFRGCDGIRGRGEGEEKERETVTDTEPHRTTLHHITHNTHAPPFPSTFGCVLDDS